MFYWLVLPLKNIFFGFNVFRYISFRALGGVVTAFLIVAALIPKWIKYFEERDFSSAMREDSLKNHQKKVTVPTMGGVVLIPAIIISSFLWMRLDCRFIYVVTLALFILGLCGAIDDYKKIVSHSSEGISAKLKVLFQTVTGIILGLYLLRYPASNFVQSDIVMPFFKNVILHLGIAYIFLTALIVTASSNAVNLTDGLDGLAIGSVMLVALAFSILAYISGNIKFSAYLGFPYIPQAGELTIFAAIIIGAGLGFLWFNAYPAEIFMGDTGSLPLGGAMGILAILTKHEFLLIIAGGIFVLEAMSVIIQVFYYKKTAKRFFKMAPLHHHFELSNWHESKVVIRFWIMGVFFVILTFITLKIR